MDFDKTSRLFTVGFILCLANHVVLDGVEDVCSMDSCSKDFPSDAEFMSDCNAHEEFKLQGHCCMNLSSDSIMGIDLSYCGLKNIRSLFHEAMDVKKINLTHNPDLKLKNTSFQGLKSLRSLTLDRHVQCPGQWEWFNTTWQAWNNTKSEKHIRRCINQTDTCTLLRENHNYTCPMHSSCVNDGPGHFLCVCDENWGGYKCLRKIDKNIKVPILTGTAAATIVLSAFMWYTQRRHVL